MIVIMIVFFVKWSLVIEIIVTITTRIAFVVLIVMPCHCGIGQRIGHSKPKPIHSDATGAGNASDMKKSSQCVMARKC